MKRTARFLMAMASLSVVPMAALAETHSASSAQSEAQMFAAAKLSLNQASDIALKEIPGKLAAVGFNDENGKGVYEATIHTADGQMSIVRIDANTGAILGKGLASVMDEEGDGEKADLAENGDNGDNEDGEDNG